MTRPSELPDFNNPPLNEVVLGVQFSTPRGYQQIFSKDVWELFRKDFPEVRELDALPPIFETFGQRSVLRQPNIELRSGATHDRFWFQSRDGSELIQFQQDRLLHNWRKTRIEDDSYPRFEEILSKFKDEAQRLSEYFVSNFPVEKLEINQCELTYVNHIVLPEDSKGSFEKWVRIANIDGLDVDDIRLSTTNLLYREDSDEPYGRLICVCNSGADQESKPIIELNITVRGLPLDSSLGSAIDFLVDGRAMIVNHFDRITTKFAHKQWEKKQ